MGKGWLEGRERGLEEEYFWRRERALLLGCRKRVVVTKIGARCWYGGDVLSIRISLLL